MRLSVLVLALFATVSAASVETLPPPPEPVEGATAPAATPGQSSLSSEVAQSLAATLPGYAPPPAAKPVEAPNPDVLELPKMTVKQRPRPRLGAIDILGPKAFNEELAKKNLSAFDRSFLNKFTLPLFGTSAAERAREDYEIAQRRQFLSDVMTIARAVELTDPAKAKALREAATKP